MYLFFSKNTSLALNQQNCDIITNKLIIGTKMATLTEMLEEKKTIKALVLQGVKDDAASGSILGHTANNTKIIYEGTTATTKLLNQLNSEIATLEANISKANICGYAV